ncbi:M20/M25/M40 family metallo-hydrolase [Desemzia sp. FAM 24101]|uniref:M20/M25/M40 family metallo-hydrolase n=1 Tax=unclassified Desemzia TaxID=2685243 RepID=UPI003883CDB2
MTTADKYNKEGSEIEVEVSMSLPSVLTSGQSKMIDLSKELGKKYLDLDLSIKASTGVTDGSNLLHGKDKDFPFMMFGPGETKMAHKVDEYVAKDVYLAFFDIYKELILGLTNEKITNLFDKEEEESTFLVVSSFYFSIRKKRIYD